MCTLTVWPVLCIVSQHRIPTLKVAHFVKIVAAWEQIQCGQRVVVLTLRNHVLVFLQDIACTEVDYKFVVEQRCSVACCEVVTVVLVAYNNTLCICSRSRNVCLVFAVAGRKCYRVDNARTSIEEFGRIEVAAHLSAPVHQSCTCAIFALCLWQHSSCREHSAVRYGHSSAVFGSTLGVDNNSTIGSVATIKGGSRRTRKHIY